MALPTSLYDLEAHLERKVYSDERPGAAAVEEGEGHGVGESLRAAAIMKQSSNQGESLWPEPATRGAENFSLKVRAHSSPS